jgi:hypothetical protein
MFQARAVFVAVFSTFLRPLDLIRTLLPPPFI